MTENSLVERLRKAKAELTALKMAHKRGAGMLELYGLSDIEVGSSGQQDGKRPALFVSVEFDRKFPPFPYICFHNDLFLGVSYSQDGYSVSSVVLFSWDGVDDWNFGVFSSSPIVHVTHRWELIDD